MYELFCRSYQNVLKLTAYFLNWRKPKLVSGVHSLDKLPYLIKREGINHILIITDKGIVSTGLIEDFLDGLKKEKITFAIYDETVPNPTITNIEDAYELYVQNNCKAIIAIGGGSPIDCAKVVGAKVAKPHMKVEQMKGLLKIRKEIPPLFVVPTTAGTGSEVTVAAVVTNSKTNEKYAINDHSLIPQYAILDPLLLVKLPPHLTAATGMDALTHAVEAYIGRSNTRETKECAKEAVQIIFNHLVESYENGENIEARAKMQRASYLAGVAFTRAYVGYVHAIAHTLGGFYHVPHGLANAVILPYVLDGYGASAHQSLAELADLVGITNENDSQSVKATKFIMAIREMNKKMNIPMKISGIQEQDIPLMVKRALSEANPLYPVPEIWGKEKVKQIYYLIKE